MHQLTESKTVICWLRGSLPQSPGTVSSIYSHRHIHHQRHPAILPATKNFWTRVSSILLSAAIMTRAWTPSSWYSWHSGFGGSPWKSLVSSCYRKVMIFRAVFLIQKVKLMGVKGNFFFLFSLKGSESSWHIEKAREFITSWYAESSNWIFSQPIYEFMSPPKWVTEIYPGIIETIKKNKASFL